MKTIANIIKKSITLILGMLLVSGVVADVVLANLEITFWYEFSLVATIVVLFAFLVAVTQE